MDNNLIIRTPATYFRSVIASGTATVVTDREEKLYSLNLLAEKYAPGETLRRREETDRGFDRLLMVRIDVERMTGKEAVEPVRARG